MIDVDLIAWAARNGISQAALADLVTTLGARDFAPALDPGATNSASEARQQSLIRMEAPKHDMWLSRNNVGAFEDPKTGRWVRYGLCNETKQQNERVKSADLIGFRKKNIVASDVGKTIAQFASVECKEEGWQYKGTKREVAQARWRDFIRLNGGIAFFANGPEVFQGETK